MNKYSIDGSSRLRTSNSLLQRSVNGLALLGLTMLFAFFTVFVGFWFYGSAGLAIGITGYLLFIRFWFRIFKR